MPNFDGTGPASVGSMAGARRGRGGCGLGGGLRRRDGSCGLGDRRGQGRLQSALLANFGRRNGQDGQWLGLCIERLEQRIAVLQQHLGPLKEQFRKPTDSAQS